MFTGSYVLSGVQTQQWEGLTVSQGGGQTVRGMTVRGEINCRTQQAWLAGCMGFVGAC